MTKTYCDICGEEIDSGADHFKLSINRGMGANTYILDYPDTCDVCRRGIASSIEEYINEKKRV